MLKAIRAHNLALYYIGDVYNFLAEAIADVLFIITIISRTMLIDIMFN